MLKVIRITTILDFGGVEKRLVNVAQSVPDNVEVTFVALGEGGWASKQIQQSHQVICLKERYRIPNYKLIFKLYKLFSEIKPDVVHSSGAEANFHAQIAAFIARVPKRISEEIGFPKHSTLAKKIFKFTYGLSNRVIGISRAVKEAVVALGEAPASKIDVVYNPIIIHSLTKEYSHEGSRTQFVTVCRLNEIKNLSRLIRVFHTHLEKSEDDILTIIGDGPERQNLEALIAQYKLEGRVVLAGFSANPVSLLQEADIFVLPSYSEGLGNAIMEAMLVGLPCIVTNQGGAKELIEEGENGWLIDPYSDESVLKAIRAASSSPLEVRREMGLKSMEAMKINFSPESHWEQLLFVYRQ